MSEEMSEEDKQAYLEAIQAQVMEILNGVKEELGVDTPVEIEVRESSTDE